VPLIIVEVFVSFYSISRVMVRGMVFNATSNNISYSIFNRQSIYASILGLDNYRCHIYGARGSYNIFYFRFMGFSVVQSFVCFFIVLPLSCLKQISILYIVLSNSRILSEYLMRFVLLYFCNSWCINILNINDVTSQ
jgi:hypothetical protein